MRRVRRKAAAERSASAPWWKKSVEPKPALKAFKSFMAQISNALKNRPGDEVSLDRHQHRKQRHNDRNPFHQAFFETRLVGERLLDIRDGA